MQRYKDKKRAADGGINIKTVLLFILPYEFFVSAITTTRLQPGRSHQHRGYLNLEVGNCFA